ncbi:hypothetical protein LR48_Vigan233s000800 [Vigna angularis]|uniref:Chromo domain-containing protein n=1 Tax=Phaseolus angularis TaxID=3914 RepID=A0A0L9T721_PHAAN|nr:hypothetical protein LR48_Vigan233s000800 [Vigna angularis]
MQQNQNFRLNYKRKMNQNRLSNRGSIHARKKMKQFLIQFKGKPAEDATWEEQLSISNFSLQEKVAFTAGLTIQSNTLLGWKENQLYKS